MRWYNLILVFEPIPNVSYCNIESIRIATFKATKESYSCPSNDSTRTPTQSVAAQMPLPAMAISTHHKSVHVLEGKIVLPR